MVAKIINRNGSKCLLITLFLLVFSLSIFSSDTYAHSGDSCQRHCCSEARSDRGECEETHQTASNAIDAASAGAFVTCGLLVQDLGVLFAGLCAGFAATGSFASNQLNDFIRDECFKDAGKVNNICVRRCISDNQQLR